MVGISTFKFHNNTTPPQADSSGCEMALELLERKRKMRL
jgi:hypothetical protein